MKFLRCFATMILISGFLCACSQSELPPESAAVTTQTMPAEIKDTQTTLSAEDTAPATLPPHSELYLPGVSVKDVTVYFNEVCLNAEFVNSGDPTALQKWMTPIYYSLNGTPTPEDRATLESLALWLNYMEGFPGIYEAQNPAETNLRIHFCSEEELLNLMGDQFIGTDGAVTFWYEEDQIYDAIICCRTDLDQRLRNSVILEEIYNALGPIQDTSLRSDSIIFSGFSQPQELTEIDRLLLKLLYHPTMECGMDAAKCEAVIRQLYY